MTVVDAVGVRLVRAETLPCRRFKDVAHACHQERREPAESDAGIAVIGKFVFALGTDVGPRIRRRSVGVKDPGTL